MFNINLFLVTVFKCPEAALHRCSSENVFSAKTQQIYRRSPMQKCDFNKVASIVILGNNIMLR